MIGITNFLSFHPETGKDYDVDSSLEQLKAILDPLKFFRINREYILNIDAISLMSSYSSSRLKLTLKNEGKSDLFASRDKVAEFKKGLINKFIMRVLKKSTSICIDLALFFEEFYIQGGCSFWTFSYLKDYNIVFLNRLL